MFEKLKEMKKKFEELSKTLIDPSVFADKKQYAKLAKQHSELADVVEKYDEYVKVEKDISFSKDAMKTEKDSEMREMFESEIENGNKKLQKIEEELKILLLEKDENDEKNVIIEIRSGAGGDEASLFASELRRMYELFAQKNNFKIEEIDTFQTELGGIKETTFMMQGKGAYSIMKYESGVHRVQRVPDTESQGRVHTSTVTVAVLPEIVDVEINIEEKDLQIDTYRSSGAGGQHVNKTESAVRITHLPTGLVSACQQERSQLKNKERAMELLKAKLYDFEKTKADAEYAEKRKTQIGSGDRSEKIRTYNFPQNRVTDHRIGYSTFSIENFMSGDIVELLQALQIADQQKRLLSSNF